MNGATDNSFSVTLESGISSPFELLLLESIASYNDSLYVPTALKLFGIEEDDEFDIEDFHLDQLMYTGVTENLQLSEFHASLVDFDLTYKVHSPRIQTHYNHYETISSRYNLADLKDSFGNPISSDGVVNCWVLFNDQIYGSVDDLYALKTDSRLTVEPNEFDRVIGTTGPLVILYANPKSEEFKLFFLNLYESAKIGKLRFVWRYVPSGKSPDILAGYGVDLSLKNTSGLVVDEVPTKKLSKQNLNIVNDLDAIDQTTEIEPVHRDQIPDLGFKFASLVLSNQFSDYSSFEILEKLLSSFPKYASYISTSKTNYDEVKQIAIKNEEIGLAKESNGIYVNGSPIHKLELDVLKLIDKIKEEAKIVFNLKELGLTTEQAKFLIRKFATLSAFKQAQFRFGNSIMGKNENRFKVYKNAFTKRSKRGVVFLNDIEKDEAYDQLTTSAEEAYLRMNLQQNQIPPLRQNVHDMILAINLADKAQLRVLFTLSKIILDKGIPQQFGILPMKGTDPLDEQVVKIFYFLVEKTSTKEALAFLYKYMESDDTDDVQQLMDKIIIDDYHFENEYFQSTLDKFDIVKPSVIVNGVIFDLALPDWQISMGKQIAQDVSLLKHHLQSDTNKGSSLKRIIYENAKGKRNTKIVPTDPVESLFKSIDKELIESSMLFQKADGMTTTFWLIGDMNDPSMLLQLCELLKVIKEADVQVRVVDSGANFPTMKTIEKLNLGKRLSNSKIDKIIDVLNTTTVGSGSNTLNREISALLEKKQIPVHHGFILYNSRYIRVDDGLTRRDLLDLIEYENNQRLSIVNDIINSYPETFDYKSISDICTNDADIYDLIISLVTKSFHVDDKMFVTDVSRFDFSTIDMTNSIDIWNGDLVDVLVIIDPIEEESQKIISILKSIKHLKFVNIKIILQPRSGGPEMQIGRFYKGVFPSTRFNENGRWISSISAKFDNLPVHDEFSTTIDVPNNWITSQKLSSVAVDLENFKLDNYENKSIEARYDLKYLLIEGYAKDVKLGIAPAGVSVSLINGEYNMESSIMSTLGYLQLHTTPGISKITLNGNGKKHYSLLSASSNKFVANTKDLETVDIPVFDLRPKKVYPRLRKNVEYLTKSLLDDLNDNSKDQADVNLFVLPSSNDDERILGSMLASVRKHSNKSIKVWIIENFVSSHFKLALPKLAEKYNLDYELISYKWPNFLRQQRDKHRVVSGYKILFLDVIFPQSLSKVIFVDTDQVFRADISELLNIDLQGAPYGFVPMGDDREDMDGFKFWKTGYWKDTLGENYKYHNSALFVVDLIKFRSLQAGERLRSHYQKLSSDRNSLSVIDQDLPNNLQRQVPIFSLPQEWLWCETWSHEKGKAKAKSIDLCHDPWSSESKLEHARRIIPEWKQYDDEVSVIFMEAEKEAAKNAAEEAELEAIENQEIENEEDYGDFDDSNDFDHDEL
jgi:UDP-glucose:glycoprotein glucosyltransferase